MYACIRVYTHAYDVASSRESRYIIRHKANGPVFEQRTRHQWLSEVPSRLTEQLGLFVCVQMGIDHEQLVHDGYAVA